MEEGKIEERNMENKKDLGAKLRVSKSKGKLANRIALNDKVVTRINTWISQIEKMEPALRISRTDIANYILFSHSVDLSPDELRELKASHYRAERFSKWFDSVVQNAIKQGKELSPEELLQLFMKCQNGDMPDQ